MLSETEHLQEKILVLEQELRSFRSLHRGAREPCIEDLLVYQGRPTYRWLNKLHYCDDGAEVGAGYWERACGHCGLYRTPEGHDGCIGTLPDPDIMNACCGHGRPSAAYVQFRSRLDLRGRDAVTYMEGVVGKLG